MLLTTTPAIVRSLWESLPRPGASPASRITVKCRADAVAICKKAAETGWTTLADAETVLVATGADAWTGRLRDVLTLFGAVPQWLYRRPGARVQGVVGSEHIAAADLAFFLLQVERAGFEVDPAPLCEAFVPGLKAKAYLTASELAVHWHDKERHRCEPVEIATGPNLTWGRSADTLRTSAGYKAELFHDEAGQPQAFKVTAPKWRRKPHHL